MADKRRDSQSQDRLPIKLIMPKQGTERRVLGGGGPPRPFRDVDDQYRHRLANQVAAIQESVLPQLKGIKAAPLRVKVIAKAAAKSHRPDTLFFREILSDYRERGAWRALHQSDSRRIR